jgi:hypothetical protein
MFRKGERMKEGRNGYEKRKGDDKALHDICHKD